MERLKPDTTKKPESDLGFLKAQKILHKVLLNLRKKRDDPNGKGKNIRPLLLVLGGGMAGCYGAGQVCSLCHSGYLKVFQTAVGVSAGACDVAYFLAGKRQVLIGTSIFYEECTKEKFLSLSHPRKIMDIDYLVKTFTFGKKKLDTKAIIKNPTDFYVQVVDTQTGENILVNAKQERNLILTSIHASMAVPFFYGKKVLLGSKEYKDGTFATPFPIKEVVKKFKPTDILVLPQTPYKNEHGSEKYNETLLNILVEKFTKGREGFLKGLKYIKKQKKVNIGIMYPPDCGIVAFTRDAKLIKRAVRLSAEKACEDLGEPMNFKIK